MVIKTFGVVHSGCSRGPAVVLYPSLLQSAGHGYCKGRSCICDRFAEKSPPATFWGPECVIGLSHCWQAPWISTCNVASIVEIRRETNLVLESTRSSLMSSSSLVESSGPPFTSSQRTWTIWSLERWDPRCLPQVEVCWPGGARALCWRHGKPCV